LYNCFETTFKIIVFYIYFVLALSIVFVQKREDKDCLKNKNTPFWSQIFVFSMVDITLLKHKQTILLDLLLTLLFFEKAKSKIDHTT